MFAGVGDMVGQTRQHSSGSMASKLRPSEGFMRDRYSTAFWPSSPGIAKRFRHMRRARFTRAPEDELLERERIPDEVTGNVLDGLLVLEGDRIHRGAPRSPDVARPGASGRAPGEIACRSIRRASRRSRNSFITARSLVCSNGVSPDVRQGRAAGTVRADAGVTSLAWPARDLLDLSSIYPRAPVSHEGARARFPLPEPQHLGLLGRAYGADDDELVRSPRFSAAVYNLLW